MCVCVHGQALVRERIKDWGGGLCRALGKRLVELTGGAPPAQTPSASAAARQPLPGYCTWLRSDAGHISAGGLALVATFSYLLVSMSLLHLYLVCN